MITEQPKKLLDLTEIEAAWFGANIPPMVLKGLTRYVEERCPTGDCLRAILCNDLSIAVLRADPQTLAALPKIMALLRNHAPRECWGSEAAVKAWLGGRP